MDETLPPQKLTPGLLTGGSGAYDPSADTRAAAPAGSSVAVAGMIGPFRIEVLLGKGGMGKVYRCYDERLRRRVAIKCLHDKYTDDARYQARFRREAQVLASFSHPCVAQVFSIDTAADGSLYLVMEYVEGRSLDEVLESGGALPPAQALEILRQTAAGLEAAFEHGIIHRDVKPSNLLLKPDGKVKVVDFGLAKEIAASSSLTDEGVVLGTPHYISPEQGRGLKVDQRSDIYSLGATFYHMLTGGPPFEKRSHIAVILAHVAEDPPAPHQRRPEVPVAYSQLVGRMLAREPEDRHQSYAELLDDIARLASGRAPLGGRRRGRSTARRGRFERRGRWRRAAAMAAILGVLAAAVAGVVWLLPLDAGERVARELGGWCIPGTDGVVTLNLDLAAPPSGIPDALARALRIPPPSSAGISLPRVEGRGLWLENYRQPVACSVVFSRLDEVRVHALEVLPHTDLTLAIVHPDGRPLRELALRLRPAGSTPDPLVALRRGARAAPEPALKPVPPLAPPFRVDMTLTQNAGATKVNIKVTSLVSDKPAVLYSASTVLSGSDWGSGVVAVAADSPLTVEPFAVRIAKLVVAGIPDRSRVGVLRWQN